MPSLSVAEKGRPSPLRHTGLAGAKRTLLIMTLVLIAVAVVLASCGGGGEKAVEKTVEKKEENNRRRWGENLRRGENDDKNGRERKVETFPLEGKRAGIKRLFSAS
jgi:hypothetical protein